MSTTRTVPPSALPDPATAPHLEAGRVALLIGVLRELIALAVQAARDLRDQATACNSTLSIKQISLRYARIARIVRQAIVLQNRLAAGLSPYSTPNCSAARHGELAERMEQLQRLETLGSASLLTQRQTHRLTDPPLTLDGRSIADLVVTICTGLGFTPASPQWPARLIERVSQPEPLSEPEPEPIPEPEPEPIPEPEPARAKPTRHFAAPGQHNPAAEILAPRLHEQSG